MPTRMAGEIVHQFNGGIRSVLRCVIDNRRILLAIVLIMLVGVFIRVYPYIIGDYHFEIGADTGVYEYFTNRYFSSESWGGSLPAYPPLPESDLGIKGAMEPGLFVEIGLINALAQADVHTWYRFYLPVLTCVLFVIVGYVLGSRISGSWKIGLLAATFIAISNLQYDASNESYYKQIFAIFMVLVALFGLDRYLLKGDPRYLIPVILVGGSIYFYHRATAFTYFLLLILFLIYSLIQRDRVFSAKGSLLIIGSWLFLLPAFLPNVGTELSLLAKAIINSINRASLFGNPEGILWGGGSIPAILRGFPHILIGYIIVFLPFFVLAIVGVYSYYRWKRSNVLIWMFGLLVVYIGLWLYFGNRFIFELDAIVMILAALGFFYIWIRIGKKKENKWQYKKLAVLSISILIVGMFGFSMIYQPVVQPYITKNIDGVDWIQSEIEIEGSRIFAPDYLSSNILQLGYTVAIWDYSLSKDDFGSKYCAETFMVQAPANHSFLTEFFNDNPNYMDLQIYVLWGESDLVNPLSSTQKFIPVDDYASSQWFQLVYEGQYEILKIYKFIFE